ncbi:MAG: group III truncated hemoglobin [Lewinellaceae bacterium]|nr:group III truncated hemoglobin [Lewinellaceae bacterium]
MKPDISTSEDVKQLINTFYEKVQRDDVIGYIFNDIAKVNWSAHLPVMRMPSGIFCCWAMPTPIGGNPIQKHFDLHARHPLKAAHFDRWLALFQSTVDELFEGSNADNAKFRAYAIAETWKPKFDGPFAG